MNRDATLTFHQPCFQNSCSAVLKDAAKNRTFVVLFPNVNADVKLNEGAA
jgi:hypothetical protein